LSEIREEPQKSTKKENQGIDMVFVTFCASLLQKKTLESSRVAPPV
jgi:hypothetical protein